jgi:cell division protein FtsB
MNAIMQQQAQVQEQMQAAMQELEKLKQENLTLKAKLTSRLKKLEIDHFKARDRRLTAYAESPS